ncbi:MAG TPA: helix-turn-helix domain-containing protein, partial [Gemmatales bacterium]|nr:helix-turn-helix domain-containing protein [Gemmatales bacterium]
MAQDFYSLEDAAKILGLTTQELNSMAQHREIRAFADRGTWRFKASDIDELATRRGFVSNPNFRLSDPNIQPDLKGNPSDIFSEDRAKLLSENKGEPSKGDTGKVDLAALAGDDDEGVPSSSSFVFGNKPVKGVTGSIPPSPTGSLDEDSMVPLGREPAGGSSGDSRVRLDSPSGRLPDMGVHLVDFDMKPISDPP